MRQSTLDGFESTDYTDPDWLRERHHKDGMTLEEMANAAGVSDSTILRNMRKHGVENRSMAEAAIASGGSLDSDSMRYKDEEWLREKYYSEQMSAEEVANEAEVSRSTILKNMKRMGVKRRSPHETSALRDTATNRHSMTEDYNHKEWLKSKYRSEKMSIGEMAEEAGVSQATILDNMDRHGLTRRTRGATRALRNPGEGFYHAGWGGYETIVAQTERGQVTFGLHRLVAIAEYGYEEVGEGVVHHKNNIPWDNRPSNLKVMTEEEHATHHYPEREIDEATGQFTR